MSRAAFWRTLPMKPALGVNPKYDIIKFTESYRKAERKHTLLLPAMMLLVVGFSFWLVLSSMPGPQSEEIPAFVIPVGESDTTREVGISPPPKIDFGLDMETGLGRFSVSDPPPTVPSMEPAEEQEILKARPIPAAPQTAPSLPDFEDPVPIIETTSSKGRFTPWMTPEEINRHFSALNRGHAVDFWDRGHWIAAVEGRWAVDKEEFRVVYEDAPRNRSYAWRYRTSQTREEFSLSMTEFKNQGYKLVQSQAYEMPDGTRRYQGVWQRVK